MSLRVRVGQHSEAGRKAVNQDCHGHVVPHEPQLSAKGVVLALADGISSSPVSQDASRSAVTSFLEDYYCTSDAWSVKTSAERVLVATNSWLHAQTQQSHHRYDKDRGYVCTFCALVLKSRTAHLLHVGDSRIYRLRAGTLSQLTEDHRSWISAQQSYLARALGIDRHVEIDYRTEPLEAGDVFLLTTDGVHEHLSADVLSATLVACADDLDAAAAALCAHALQSGSSDNLTAQLVRIEALPPPEANELVRQLAELPLPPLLAPRMPFDGYQIVREIKGSSRSHIYLALDTETQERVVIKTPAIEQQNDPASLERFLMEEWIARRLNSAHVLKPCGVTRPRHYIYVVTEFIDGQTLAQWLLDNPRPDLATVRNLISQIARGLQAFHRLEMVHQDLKPDNLMIDSTGTLKIIDFGAARVAGISEIASSIAQLNLLGSMAYAAPEYFLGEPGTARSDQYSLAVIAYQMLTGKLPYGARAAQTRTRAAQKKLVYPSVLDDDREIPAWVDDALRKALDPDPQARYGEISEFVHDLHRPNPDFLRRTRPPLIERHPVLFWKTLALLLAFALALLALIR